LRDLLYKEMRGVGMSAADRKERFDHWFPPYAGPAAARASTSRADASGASSSGAPSAGASSASAS
ncbi:hypothetical protein OC842_007973, partial [Tilletia horrida]